MSVNSKKPRSPRRFKMISSQEVLRRGVLALIDENISELRLNETLSDDRELVAVCKFARRELRQLRSRVRSLNLNDLDPVTGRKR